MSCNCKQQIEDLEMQLRIVTASLEEKDQQMEDEIMKNLELEEKIFDLDEKNEKLEEKLANLEDKSEENRQLLMALMQLQSAFEKFQENFDEVGRDLEAKDKIIDELREKCKKFEPRETFDVIETSIFPKNNHTLAWDDFCERFSDSSSISDKSPEVFKFNESTFEIHEGSSMESTIFNLKSSKIHKNPTKNIRKSPKTKNLNFVQCKFCNKLLTSEKSLKFHMSLHAHKCKICNKSFAKKFSLKFHMKQCDKSKKI